MGREALLGALLEHNRRHGLSTAIWGEGAAEAASQAAALGSAVPWPLAEPGGTAYRLDTPLDLAYAVRCDAPERLHFPVCGGLPGLDASPQTLEVGLLKGAVVREWQGYHLIHQGGGLVADGSSAYWPLVQGGLAGHGVLGPMEPRRREQLPEAFVVCDDLDTTNFCHFVCDLLPKIALAGECRRRIPIVIEPPSQPFQRDLLDRVQERCGHPVVPLEPGMELAVERLFYLRRAGHIHPLLRCSGLAMAWVRQLVGVRPGPAADASLLYLRRQRRRVLNEEALICALQRHTSRLQVIDRLEDFAVVDQVALVARHQRFVSTHGAAFTHLLFADQAPTMALELMPEGMGSLAFALISARLGIDHRIHVAAHVASEHGEGYPDLAVDVDAVMTLLTAG